MTRKKKVRNTYKSVIDGRKLNMTASTYEKLGQVIHAGRKYDRGGFVLDDEPVELPSIGSDAQLISLNERLRSAESVLEKKKSFIQRAKNKPKVQSEIDALEAQIEALKKEIAELSK